MRSNMSGLLNPIKINHSSSFILPAGDHNGTYNKNSEKIKMLQLDLETSKDTVIKLRSELVQKNQEIKNLKYNKKGQNAEHQYTLKVIETVLRLIDPNIFNKTKKEKESNTATYNTINHEINGKEEENNKEAKEEYEKELNINISNLNKRNIKPNTQVFKTERSPKKLGIANNKLVREFSYINSLQNKVNLLKELITKKNNEIKEIQKTTNTESFSNLQDNFEKNYVEMENIKKQNEIMKTKIEDMTNLLFMEKEGNKSLKSKLQIFQSNFKEYQENSEKKNIDLEAKLFKAQEKERDCRIFHTRKATELDDGERLKMAEKEINLMKKDIEGTNKEIESRKEEYDTLKNNKLDLLKQVKELKETNNKLNSEYLNLCGNANHLKKNKMNLEKDNRESKIKLNKIKMKLKDEQDKSEKIKQNLKNKEKEILLLKKEIEKLKANNNFKDGTFFTSIGAKGKTKADKLEDLDVNIDEELAEIERKYNMLNQQNKLEEKNEEEKNGDNKNKDIELLLKENNDENENKNKEDDLKELIEKESKDLPKEKEEKKDNEIEKNQNEEEVKDYKEKETKEENKDNKNKEDAKDKEEKDKNKEKGDDKEKNDKINNNNSEEIKTLRELLNYNSKDSKELKELENKQDKNEQKTENTNKNKNEEKVNQVKDKQNKNEQNEENSRNNKKEKKINQVKDEKKQENTNKNKKEKKVNQVKDEQKEENINKNKKKEKVNHVKEEQNKNDDNYDEFINFDINLDD